jgi:protein-tyrosine phosphatase
MDDARVHWPATNLRELGGYATPHGRVRRGVLFRGGRMDELDDEGTAVYRGLGLHTVVDLRRPDEVAVAPTPRFGDERNVHLSVSTGTNAFAEAAARADDPETAAEVLAKAGEYYRSLVTDRLPLWQPVFDAILAAEGAPVLFHCTAGKDRTGFVAAALLKFLDVDDEVVVEDYELTTIVRRPWVEERLEYHRRRLAGERGIALDEVDSASLDAWRALMSAPVDLLRESFAAVDEHFGGWHAFRREGLGITDDRLAAWRAAVVEEAAPSPPA